MDRNDFLITWEKVFFDLPPVLPPVPFLLRKKLKEFWFRLHYFSPEKRYPDNEIEEDKIVDLLNQLISDFIKENDEFFLVVFSFIQDQNGIPEGYQNVLDLKSFSILPVQKLGDFDSEMHEPNDIVSIAYNKMKLKKSELNPLFKSVIHSEINQFIIFEMKVGNIIMPYDGGVDLLIKDSFIRNRIKKKYSVWLSKSPTGL